MFLNVIMFHNKQVSVLSEAFITAEVQHCLLHAFTIEYLFVGVDVHIYHMLAEYISVSAVVEC